MQVFTASPTRFSPLSYQSMAAPVVRRPQTFGASPVAPTPVTVKFGNQAFTALVVAASLFWGTQHCRNVQERYPVTSMQASEDISHYVTEDGFLPLLQAGLLPVQLHDACQGKSLEDIKADPPLYRAIKVVLQRAYNQLESVSFYTANGQTVYLVPQNAEPKEWGPLLESVLSNDKDLGLTLNLTALPNGSYIGVLFDYAKRGMIERPGSRAEYPRETPVAKAPQGEVVFPLPEGLPDRKVFKP